MKKSRKEFLRDSALLAAASAIGLPVSKDSTASSLDTESEWMDLSIAHWHPQEKRMQLAKMMGATGAVSGSGGDPAARKQEFENAGLEWTVLEGVNLTKAQLGVEGKDEVIENFVQLIEDCAAVGQEVICYNWMPAVSWSRSDEARADRGGSLVTAFDIEDADQTPTEYGNDLTHKDLWNNMEYFLQAVVPEAEKHGVKLALHPDDPPVARLRGIPRIMTSVDAFKRMTEIYPSPYNGICFCQGSFASQKDIDISEAIRYFGERDLINFVHFRDVRGHTTNFIEA